MISNSKLIYIMGGSIIKILPPEVSDIRYCFFLRSFQSSVPSACLCVVCRQVGWLLLSCPHHLALQYEFGYAYDKVPYDLTLPSNIHSSSFALFLPFTINILHFIYSSLFNGTNCRFG